MYWRWSQVFLTAFLLVLTGVAWAAFAPVQVGGLASYVIISGVSMEPHFQHGDLVIVRRALDYQVGEVAAYRNADLGGNVFHRIVGQDLDRFIFRGDNNTWLDSYRPTEEELIGRLWMHIPKAGKAILWVRVPLNMAFTVGILGGMVMAGSLLDKPERKGRKRTANKPGGALSGVIEAALLGLGFLFLASLALGIYAFAHPVWREADPVKVEHQGTFSYSAQAAAGIYDGKTVKTGEPIFPTLTCSLNLRFAYTLSFRQLEEPVGTYQVTARIYEEQSNWQRTMLLQEETAFQGDSFTSNFTVDLCQVENLVAAMEEATGFHPASYKLEILPSVNVQGTFAGGIFKDAFEPALVFRFDSLHFYLNRELGSDPLNHAQSSLLPDPTLVHNRVPLFGADPRVISLRFISVVGLVISSLGLLAVGLLLANTSRRDPQAFIRMKYGAMLVDVSGRQAIPATKLVEVTSIDDLARLAERNNVMICHDTTAAVPSYYVDLDGKSFCYKQEGGIPGSENKRGGDAR